MNPAVVPQMNGMAAVPKVIAPRVAEVRPKTTAVVDETTMLRSMLRLAGDGKWGTDNMPGPVRICIPKPEMTERRLAVPD